MAKAFFDVASFHEFISPATAEFLLQQARPAYGISGLSEVGAEGGSGSEDPDALRFLLQLYGQTKRDLQAVLSQREIDRRFIDDRTRASGVFNDTLGLASDDPDYETALGMEDAFSRVVFGPKSDYFSQPGGPQVAPVPEFLQGPHVTLFGPPDNAKLAINAMNAFHRQVKGEPAIVEELLSGQPFVPMWGADFEDSKTPLHADLVEASANLKACYNGSLTHTDLSTGKFYSVASNRQAVPIKRFAGLALPCGFLFYERNPLPLHLYDFALHVYKNWQNPKALVFYVPKIESEEEARYLHRMIATAEAMLQTEHPEYVLGTIRIMLVVENPRAILRLHEIIDELFPYFVGASLGWHDYLASTARLFKEDHHYRIPVKADPNIVIKYIKASHQLLADVVGSRGGIKVGGMYGILPSDGDLFSPSFQVALAGFFKDVIIQLKRGLNGFWVAHPDFVRIGLGLVEAWRQYQLGSDQALKRLVIDLLNPDHAAEILQFIASADVESFRTNNKQFLRSLLVADLKESEVIANNHPSEVRYNVFQTLQYLADWLAGRGCVALPTTIDKQSVRVMDDLATAERSRWEVWHEVRHGRLALPLLVQIAHQELHFIRTDQTQGLKTVQVKWDARTAPWYPLALRIMLQLMTNPRPVEFATELLLAFTLEPIRTAADPWSCAISLDTSKYELTPKVARLHYYFECCGVLRLATELARDSVLDLQHVKKVVQSLSLIEIIEGAHFHGDIGESRATLDAHAATEQSLVAAAETEVIDELKTLGKTYQEKFGFKFLISARGQSATSLCQNLRLRLNNSLTKEIENARTALWQITEKRMIAEPIDQVVGNIQSLFNQHRICGSSVAVTCGAAIQNLSFGSAKIGGAPVHARTIFQLASLSKTLATAVAFEYFLSQGISLATPVNQLLAKAGSPVRLKSKSDARWSDEVTIRHLVTHTALNMHYVTGFSPDQPLPSSMDLLLRPECYGYPDLEVLHAPGSIFQYSGGGFLVLEHLLEAMSKLPVQELAEPFLDLLAQERSTSRTHSPADNRYKGLSFDPKLESNSNHADGYFDDGTPVAGGRLRFPACAAGGSGSAGAMLSVLQHLEYAFHDLDGSGPLSHDTAVEMLQSFDKGALAFMGCLSGAGVFISEAEGNRLMVHQGANEGFRALYVHCYSGPQRGIGFVILCNGDNGAVPFIANVAQQLLQHFQMEGVDFDVFERRNQFFTSSGIKQEEIVNSSYKNLLFDAFVPTLPERISIKGPADPLAPHNLALSAEIYSVSNQRFARAENLISAFLPRYDPNLYGNQGKIMDSWESVRHNLAASDFLQLRLKAPQPIRYVAFSTAYHDGNQAAFVSLSGSSDSLGPWQKIVPKMAIDGHSALLIDLGSPTPTFPFIRVDMYPDGGLSRLGLYQDLPTTERENFKPLAVAKCQRYSEAIPKSQKPLTIDYPCNLEKVRHNIERAGNLAVDFASLAFGGRIVKTSNQHYGPATQLISPYPPLHMFDGLESARSRAIDNSEYVEVQLGCRTAVTRIVLDFTFFINNNPSYVSIAVWNNHAWRTVIEKTSVKAFGGNMRQFVFSTPIPTERVLVRTYPDGGINRLHVFGFNTAFDIFNDEPKNVANQSGSKPI